MIYSGFEVEDDVKEYRLQQFWSEVKKGTFFKAVEGDDIEILFPGVWNMEEGPDFRDAVIKRHGSIYKGDIEIHLDERDWLRHGHSIDMNYNNVILHVVKSLAGKNFKTELNTVQLVDCFIKEFDSRNIKKYPIGGCSSYFQEMKGDAVTQFFIQCGCERIKEKSLLSAKGILKYGSNKAILMNIMDALGYKKNRVQFRELFLRVSEYEIENLSLEEVSAILWGESGLLPDPSIYEFCDIAMKCYVESKWEIWWKLRKCDRNLIKWNLCGIRPQNHPCRRIAAFEQLISNFSLESFFDNMKTEFLNCISEQKFWVSFTKRMISRDVLWDNYSSFNKKLKFPSAVLGESRSKDIMVNVLIPFFYAYFIINKDYKSACNIIEIFTKLPSCQSNIIIRMSMERWFAKSKNKRNYFNSAAEQQGIHYIYDKYCRKLNMNCSKCGIKDILDSK